jgi:hypothetical protein
MLFRRRRLLRRLTSPRGWRYITGMVRRVDSSSGAGIQLARKKQILIFDRKPDLTNLLLDPYFKKVVISSQDA